MVDAIHIFTAKYISPTSKKGSRIKIYSARYNQSVTINYETRMDDDVLEYLNSKGYDIQNIAEGKGLYYFTSHVFKPLKEME